MITTRKATVSIALVTLSLLLALPANVHANGDGNPVVYYVAPSPLGSGTSGGSCSAPGFNTVQSAVNFVAANSEIIVCPGTYTEQVMISKSLILVGSGPSQTTIKAPTVLLSDTAGQFSIVNINGGASVSISSFTISGPGPTGCDSLHYGIFVNGGATAQILDNSIVHIRDNPFGGCQNGAGIRVGRMFTGDTGTASIIGNSISDYQKGGIVIDNTGTKATVSYNTVTGVGPSPFIAQNGIQVGRGASATVSYNTVTGNECNVPAPICGPDPDANTQSGGILLFNDAPGPLNVKVEDNNIFGNDDGVLPFFLTGGTSVTSNNIHDNRFGNVVAFDVNNTFFGDNTISVSDPSAAAPACKPASFCFGHSYTLGIDVLDASTGNNICRNSVTVTADKYAILLDSSTSKNSVICNTLSANHGAATGSAAVQDLGIGNTVSSCCRDADGNGDFHGDHGDGNFNVHHNACERDQDKVDSSNRGDGRDFQSTQVNLVQFDSATNTFTMAGLGTSGGIPVAFVFTAVPSGPATLGWVSFAFSDGYTNAGPLTIGSITIL